MTPPPAVEAFTVPAGRVKLTPRQWRQIEVHLQAWKAEVLAAARRHPARSYRLGVAQVNAFADLLGNLNSAVPALAANFGGVSPTSAEALQWARTYTLHELDDALNVYIGQIKDALLYGLRGAMNPTAVASLLYNATKDARVNWRRIARTEMARANAEGRLDAIESMGYDRVWSPPHMGSCRHCKRILENEVFRLEDVRGRSNYGRAPRDWIACCPLHPHCRHGWLPYEPEVYEAMQAQYRALENAGLDERALDELFDSSGQLADGAADDPRLQQWLDTQKIDPHGELLTLAVLKATRPVDVAKRAPTEEWIPADELRTDLYQRAVDPQKVLAMHAALRRGEDLEKPRVSLREDGTTFVTDGQHRVHARRLHGDTHVLCDVSRGMDWGQEAEACREAIAKLLTWDAPAEDLLPVEASPADQVRKADTLVDQLAWGAAEPVTEPEPDPELAADPHLFDGHRLRDDAALALEQWWEHVTGPDWSGWSRLYVTAAGVPLIAVDYDQLRAQRAEWRKLADVDLHLALVAAVLAAARERDVYPGMPLEPVLLHAPGLTVDPAMARGPVWDLATQGWALDYRPAGDPADLAKTLPDYAWSVDSAVDSDDASVATALPLDLADRLVDADDLAKAHDVSSEPRNAHGEWTNDAHSLEFSPGRKAARTRAWGRGLVLPDGRVRTWPEDDMTTHADMVNAIAPGMHHRVGTFIVRHDGWTKFYGVHTRPEHVDRALEADRRLWVDDDSHRLVGKSRPVDELDVTKLAVKQGAANAGVEHWITIHPHGDSEKGQPVLVRNNADGSMSVIGGAGGNLNMMRLDPSRRVDRGEDGKPKGATGGSKVEQAVTEEEAEAKQREREQQIDAAREALKHVKEQRDARQGELHDYLREHVGVDLDDPELSHQDRQKLMKKLRVSAMRTLAYGPIQRRDVAEGATPDDLDLDSADAPKPWLKDDDEVKPEGENESQERTPRPSVAMGEDHAKELLDALLDLRELQGIGTRHRRVIAGEERGADALQIDWSAGSDSQARDSRRAAAVKQQIRTDLSRSILDSADEQLRTDKKGKKKYDAHFKLAHAQGGFDSIDAFTHSILGESVLSKEAYNLLGVAGAAQLVGHTIQQRAAELGKQGLDLNKVQAALKQLTDEQESKVNKRGLARAKRALDRSSQAYAELAKTESGESLYTSTMARSIGSEKAQEAKRALGMMVGGLEACSAMKTALDRKAGEKIKVGGFSSPATIKEAAQRARIKLGSGDVVRVGAGNYTLSIDPAKLEGLVRPEGKGDEQLRARLQGIRSGKDLQAEVRAARTGPGMSDTLDENQAKGKLFLRAAGSGVLAFDPGVGKTHTAIAAAMEKMAAEPGKHRALIVCPGNVARSWANTIRSQGDGEHTCDLVGEHQVDPSKDTSSTKVKASQLGGDAHFTIVSYDSLKGANGQKILRQLHDEGRSHSIVIADELQMGKDEGSQRHKGVEKAVDHARDVHGDDAAFWGLTGTPIEKDVGDLHAMQKLVKRAKGQEFADRKAFRSKFGAKKGGGGFGQEEHIARGDKIREFRKGLDEDLFRLSAADAGNDLGAAGYNHVHAELEPEHRQAILDRVKGLNAQIADYHARKVENGGDGGGSMPEFGGRAGLLDALYNHPKSSLAKKAADLVDGLGSFHFDGMADDHEDGNYKKGDHAGTYEHKAVLFGASEHSKALFGVHESGKGFDPEGKGGVAGELRKRGVKVFVGHGQMGGDAKNEASYKAFLAHKGKAVFVTNDKNNAGISLQFGDNKGAFQHGATHMIHYTRPVNNATIQQREARILRKGAQASFEHSFRGKDGKTKKKTVGAAYHVLSADTPVEQKLEETLEREARTQDLAANSEQRVAGADTLAHHLKTKGVKVPE